MLRLTEYASQHNRNATVPIGTAGANLEEVEYFAQLHLAHTRAVDFYDLIQWFNTLLVVRVWRHFDDRNAAARERPAWLCNVNTDLSPTLGAEHCCMEQDAHFS